MPVSGDRYANEFFSAASPDGRTLALSARGTASSQWWRNGHSHLDEAEIWLRDLTAADTPSAWRPLTTAAPRSCGRCGAGDGASLYFMLGPQRRGEHLADRHRRRRRSPGRSPISPRARVVAVGDAEWRDDRVRARLRNLEARHGVGQAARSADRPARRAGRAVGRSSAADQPVFRPGPVARRPENRVRRPRRDLRRLGQRRRRRGADHRHRRRAEAWSPGRPTAASWSTRQSATAPRASSSTTSRPSHETR